MILSEFSDIPDSSHVPIVQSLEVAQTEHSPVQGEFVPAEEAATSDPSLAANEQPTEAAQTEHSPVQGEFVPAEVDNADGATHTPVEQAALSKQVEVETVSAESEEPSFAGDEDTLSSLEISPPISNNTSSRTEEPPLTEANSFSDQMASEVSTEPSNDGPQRTTRPRKKRGFLRRLFAVFFGR